MAIRTISVAGGNWNSTSTWDEGVVPNSADDVVARGDGTSGNLTVNVASACKSIVLTNYVGTLTINALLDVFGTVTFVAGMSVGGTNQLRFNTTATLTSGGLTIPWSLLWAGTSQTFTLGDNWNCSGNNSFGGTTSLTVNGNQIISTSTVNIGGAGIAGNTTIVMAGTGAIQGSGTISCNLNINSPSGTITIGSSGNPNLRFSTNTLTYTSGNILFGSASTALSVQGSCTLNVAGITWQGIIFNAANTTTLTSNLTTSGNLNINAASVINGVGRTVYVGGSLITSQTTSGTVSIELTGTGSWTSGVVNLSNNLIFNNGANTFTISTTVYYVTGTITYTSGNINTVGSTLVLGGTSTLNTNGILWNNVHFSNGGTITLISNFNINGNMSLTQGTLSWNNGVNLVSVNGDMTLGTLTYISTASFVFNVPNNLTINNLTLYTTAVNSSSTNNCQINGLYTININGNLTTTTASFWVGFISGNSTLKMTGTGTIFTVYGACIGNPLVIDTTGTITFGSTVSVGGASFTYVNGGILNDRNCTLQIMLSQTMGLGKSIVFANIAQGYATQAIAWSIGVTLTNDLATLGTYSTGVFAPINPTPINGAGYYLYVGGFNNSRTTSGTATIVFAYSGTWASSAYLSNNIIVDTTGTLTWGNTSYYQSGTITFVKGNFSRNPWYLYNNMTLLDVDNVIIPNVVITAGLTITINKMFEGSPSLKSNISSTTTSNYILFFNNQTEQFTKFIKISNATITRQGQLTVLTNRSNNGGNSGIKFYPNQLMNGFAKNNPTVPNTQTYGFGGILSDSIFN